MHRMYEPGTKVRLSFSSGPHIPVNMGDSMEVNVSGEKPTGNGTFAVLFCAIFHMPSFHKSFQVLRDFHCLFRPETVQLPASYILSAMFAGACGLPEKQSLALVQHSNILHMIVKLANLLW